MATADTLSKLGIGHGSAGLEAAGALLGAAFTFGLFFGVSHFEAKEPAKTPDNIVEMRALSIPMDTPPPRPAEAPPVATSQSPFAGLEAGPSESEVKVAVVPPDLEQFMPAAKAAPAAAIQATQLYTEFRPKMDISADFSRIFQQSEVDQRPTVLSRPNPVIPPVVRRGADSLRVVLLLVVNERGGVQSLRIVQSSGNPEFDDIIAHEAKDSWVFTPAVRKGRRVKCLVEQAVRVNWSGTSSPFEL